MHASRIVLCLTLGLLPCLSSAQAPSTTPKPSRPNSPALTSRVVSYDPTQIVQLRGQVRYTTLIVLPAGEQILDVTCGDKEFWLVNAAQNLCYIKPARSGVQTNLNLLTTSGTVYSFALSEVSQVPGAQPDLKVYVESADQAIRPGGDSSPVFVSAQQVEEYRHQIEAARLEVAKANETARAAEEAADKAAEAAASRVAAEIDEFRAGYPLTLRFPYVFPKKNKPFNVSAIFHDDRCTFIRADTTEVPALYELKDGTPNLVQFDYRDGLYVVGKVLDKGYLAIGRKQFHFMRQE